MNRRLLLLTFGNFTVGTAMYAFLGVLGALAEDLEVPLARAGQLATGFAVTFALVAPVLVPASRRFGAKKVLAASLAAFGVLNLLSAAAPSFRLLFGLRVVAAAVSCVFGPLAGAVATTMVKPEQRGKALAAVVAGVVLALAAGVPLGTLVGGAFGWRATFAFSGVLNLVGAVAIALAIPRTEAPAAGPPSFTFLRRWDAASNLVMVMVAFAGVFLAFGYIGPVLERLTGFGARGVGGLQAVVGLGGAVGTALGGALADRSPSPRVMAAAFIGGALGFLPFTALFALAAPGSTLAIVGCAGALLLGSASMFALVPVLQFRVVRAAGPEAPTALAFYFSFFYFGQGLGTAAGGLVVAVAGLAQLGLWAAVVLVLGAGVALRADAGSR
ncbi:MAG: MFS transporter [Myxococcota bacterium]